MEIKDLAGISKPLEKLIEVTAQGLGKVTKAHFIRKDADAKAYEIRRMSEAIHDARQLLGDIEFKDQQIVLSAPQEKLPALAERSASRRDYVEQLEQLNIEEIVSHAAEELSQENEVSEESVDPDWIKRFFDSAKDVSNEQLQIIWGKILAGEVKQPGSYSLRTLEVIRNLKKSEAETFVKVAKLAFRYGNKDFIYHHGNVEILNEKYNMSFVDFLILKELGLIDAEDLSLNFDSKNGLVSNFVYGRNLIIVEIPEESSKIRVNCKGFTTLGSEMLSLIEIPYDDFYCRRFAKHFANFGASVKLAEIESIEGDKIYYDSNVQILESGRIDTNVE